MKSESGLGASFLPEDYLQRKVEGRTGVLMVILFCVVMTGVVGAFFVTNRQWSAVKTLQEQINVQYAAEAKKIEQLKVLEAQKAEMMDKAEITTALIEKVPRSILMAELINRMPADLALTALDLVSKKIVEAPAKNGAKKPAPRSLTGKPPATQGPAKEDKDAPERPKPPRFEYTLTLTGLAKTDEDIADYTAMLQQCGLLERVEFKFSGDVTIDDAALRKFRIEASIRSAADARSIEPLLVHRVDGGAGPIDRSGTAVIEKHGLRRSAKPLPGSGAGATANVPDRKE